MCQFFLVFDTSNVSGFFLLLLYFFGVLLVLVLLEREKLHQKAKSHIETTIGLSLSL